jgi:E3 ubiquitin-protein ligase TRIP12
LKLHLRNFRIKQIEGTQGDHAILSPAYNVTKDEVELIVDLFVSSVEGLLNEYSVHKIVPKM